MDHQQGLIVGVSSRGRPVEGSRNHNFVTYHGELVMELVATGEAGGRRLEVVAPAGHCQPPPCRFDLEG